MFTYLIAHFWLLWLIASILLLILELCFGDFFVTCFALGALVSLVVSLFGVPFWLQVVVFAVGGVFFVYTLRPRLLRALHGKGEDRESNADALIGREGIVTEPITEEKDGYVKVDGDEWRAESIDGKPIGRDAKVRIVSMESIVVHVTKVD